MTQPDEPHTIWQGGVGRLDDDLTVEIRGGEPPTVRQFGGVGTQRSTAGSGRPGAEPPTVFQPAANGRRAQPGKHPGDLGSLSERYGLSPDPSSALLGSGAEARVWRALDRETGDIVALKIYHAVSELPSDLGFDPKLRERLAAERFRAHVPRLTDWGWCQDAEGRRVAYEAMEYMPRGSLADLMKREGQPGGGLPPERARAVLRALVTALRFWEDVIHHRQLDLSPGNVLVRSDGDPPQLVLSDFGGVRGTGLSQALSDLQVKVGYMAPEALGGGNEAKSPYWSLGMMVTEMITGRSVIANRDQRSFRVLLATDDVDVSWVPDPRWRRLIEGLLTRRPDDRWGPDEVDAWLRGDDPPLRREERRADVPALEFAGLDYDDAAALALAMTRDSDTAVQWLRAGGVRQLRQWLGAHFPDLGFDLTQLAGVGAGPVPAHRAVTAFAVAAAPLARPVYRGRYVDEEGLLRLAQDPGLHPMLQEVVDGDVLAVAAGYSCGHHSCTAAARGVCLVLESLATSAPRAASTAMDRLARVRRELSADESATLAFGTAPPLSGTDYPRVLARCVDMMLSPDNAERVIRALRSRALPRARWWQEVDRDVQNRERRTAPGAAALVVAEELLDPATTYRTVEDRLRRETHKQRRARSWQSLKAFLSRRPGVPTPRFSAPGWLGTPLFVLIPLSVVEPLYLWVATQQHLAPDPQVRAAAAKTMAATAPYTRWASDWLTPMLLQRVAPRWEALAVYPVVLLVALLFMRRSGGGRAATSWLALPAAVMAVVVGLGFLMHLVATNAAPLWTSAIRMQAVSALVPIVVLAILLRVARRRW